MKQNNEPEQFRPELHLVVDLNKDEANEVGYYLKDIMNHLTTEEYKDFENFMRGQTVRVYKNKNVVYRHDFDKWRGQYNA